MTESNAHSWPSSCASFTSHKTGREDMESQKGDLFLKRHMKNVGRNKEKLCFAQVLST